MSIFESFSFEWEGRKHVIPASSIMRAIAVVEQHVTLHEIVTMMNERKTVRMVQLSAAYAALLRFVGEDVTDEQVYAGFFAGEAGADTMVAGLMGLQKLMVPPSTYKGVEDAPSKKSNPTNEPGSSRELTKRPVAPRTSADGA